jgi:hypothetical protein
MPGQPGKCAKGLLPLNFRQLPVFCLFAALLPGPALAWSPAGHEIAAAIALGQLTPQARAQVGRLLGSPEMMIHDASWADEIRDARPETGPWHYVNLPLQAGSYDPRRDCPTGDCVVAQIERNRRILADRKAPGPARAEALRFLIHFVADLHQPLHAGKGDDRGGNLVQVRLGRMRTNLHKVWDNDVVLPLEGSAMGPVSPAQRRDWASGTPARWANESHAIAREHIYPPLWGARDVRLPRNYAVRETPLARILLAKAGTRLAWLINTALN